LLPTEDSSEVVEEVFVEEVEEAVAAFVVDLLVKDVKKADMKSIDNRVSKKEVTEEWEAVADGDLSIDAIIVANADHLVIDRPEVMDKK
jgi:hypothetical protein